MTAQEARDMVREAQRQHEQKKEEYREKKKALIAKTRHKIDAEIRKEALKGDNWCTCYVGFFSNFLLTEIMEDELRADGFLVSSYGTSLSIRW